MMDIKQLRENISKKLNHETDSNSNTSVSSVEDSISASHSNSSSSAKTANPPMAIGATIHIKGDVTGDEDLIIHGHVEGQINLKDYNVLGNVVSPRVTLEDGAMFKGSIEMEPQAIKSLEKNSTNKFDSSANKSSAI